MTIAALASNSRWRILRDLRFYSRLPSGRTPHLKPSLDRIAPVLPLASLSIGLLPALVLLALQLLGTRPSSPWQSPPRSM